MKKMLYLYTKFGRDFHDNTVKNRKCANFVAG